MKAIRTRYLSPGNVRGARIKASDCDGNSVTIGYDHSLDSEGCHEKAAQALLAKMQWDGPIIGGGLAPGEMAWVFVPARASQAA